MSFRIYTDASGSYEDFGDDDRYRFNGAGLLEIDLAGGRLRVYSTNAWTYIEERRSLPAVEPPAVPAPAP